MTLDGITDCLAGLGSSTRMEVFQLLVTVSKGGLPVGEVQAELGRARIHLVTVGLMFKESLGASLIFWANHLSIHGVIELLMLEYCSLGSP